MDLSDVALDAGDLVIIQHDIALVKELQKGHGDWVDTMAEVSSALSHAGLTFKYFNIINIMSKNKLPHFILMEWW